MAADEMYMTVEQVRDDGFESIDALVNEIDQVAEKMQDLGVPYPQILGYIAVEFATVRERIIRKAGEKVENNDENKTERKERKGILRRKIGGSHQGRFQKRS